MGDETRGKKITLTDFERDVVISVLQTALSAWDTVFDEDRQDAARRVVNKLLAADRKVRA